jgi:Fic family protein
MATQYPSTTKEWIKYLTINRYYTFFEIENRKKLIEESGCDYIKVTAKIKQYRLKNRENLFNFGDKHFYFVETFRLKESMDKIKEFWKSFEYNFQDDFGFKLLRETLIEEGYYSSTIEGANTTVKRARTLAYGKSEPQNKSEFMVLNNFRALSALKDKTEPLSHELIWQTHKATVQDSLDEGYSIGSYRTEPNEIINTNGKVIFSPIANIDAMNQMLDYLIEFLRDDEFAKPIENIYKAIGFHFLFAYIHPFDDGNGRTVRILFSYLLKIYGYDMFYYISLSEIIYKKKGKDYYKAFIDVERSDVGQDKNFDMTYFFYYMSDVMLQGLEVLKHRINTYLREDIIKRRADNQRLDLTPRQNQIIEILSDKNKSFLLTKAELAKKCSVSQQTIQKDLTLMGDFDLIDKLKASKGNKYYYRLKVGV